MATRSLALLPSNMTSHTRVLFRYDDADVHNETVSTNLSSQPIEHAQPMRSFYAWKGKRNLEGLHYFQTTGAMIPFESRLEALFLMTADHARDVIGVSAQPLALLWPRGTEGRQSHVPDFFLRHANGDGTVVDVRAAAFVEKSQAQFDATAEVCEGVGWNYEVWTGLDRHHMDGITFISGYRHDRCAPFPDLTEALLDVYADGISLDDGLPWVARRAGVPEHVALAGLYHLVWRQDLAMDMTRPLKRPGFRSDPTEGESEHAQEVQPRAA